MKISQKKRDKICEQILNHLFQNFPKTLFTAEVARSVARDEEFTKTLLQELKTKNILVCIDKNPKGFNYTRRRRWRLSNKAYEAYLQANKKATNNISENISS